MGRKQSPTQVSRLLGNSCRSDRFTRDKVGCMSRFALRSKGHYSSYICSVWDAVYKDCTLEHADLGLVLAL